MACELNSYNTGSKKAGRSETITFHVILQERTQSHRRSLLTLLAVVIFAHV